MTQPVALINTKLIESLTQIILSLTDEERQLLAQKINFLSLSSEEIQLKREALQSEITLGAEQLKSGDYTEYNDLSLPNLLKTIKSRGKQRIQQEQA